MRRLQLSNLMGKLKFVGKNIREMKGLFFRVSWTRDPSQYLKLIVLGTITYRLELEYWHFRRIYELSEVHKCVCCIFVASHSVTFLNSPWHFIDDNSPVLRSRETEGWKQRHNTPASRQPRLEAGRKCLASFKN